MHIPSGRSIGRSMHTPSATAPSIARRRPPSVAAAGPWSLCRLTRSAIGRPSFPDVAFRLEMYAQAYVTHMELQTPVLYL